MCQVMPRLTAPILTAAYPRTAAYVREERVAELKTLFLQEVFARGLFTRMLGDIICLAPPLVTTDEQIDTDADATLEAKRPTTSSSVDITA